MKPKRKGKLFFEKGQIALFDEHDHEHCGECGRKLLREKWRKLGMGPICHRKWLARQNAPALE